ncbi:hypothetical protein OYC51_13365 [Escherichia coli]|nr:hypothetical protein [Escherichia coli]MCY6720249.1 hypothetical protein [Escherichia coli]HDZ9784811.1 hypothetical protein [Klebsiella variicola subsp. variicola]
MSQNGTTNERFYKSENRLFHADTVTNKSTGEVVEISNSLEKLYAYMLNQYRYRKGLKQPFAESQERLGTVARIGDAKKKTKPQIDKLIALGLVEITGKVGRCNIYKVIDVDKVAGNLEFSYPEWAGEPMYDHEKRLGKSSQQPKNEEKKGDGESDQGGAGKRDGVPPVGVPVDADLSGGDDAVNGGNAIQSPTVKSPDQPQMADIDTLNHWVEGHDDEGFTEYGVLWGITKPGAITDLIKSHIRKIQSDGYKGSRSAANDDRNSADVHYKQRQEQAAAEAKRAVNAPDDHSPPDFNDDEEF